MQPAFVELSDQEAQAIQGGINSLNGGPHVTGDYEDAWADGLGGTYVIRLDGSKVHYTADGTKDSVTWPVA